MFMEPSSLIYQFIFLPDWVLSNVLNPDCIPIVLLILLSFRKKADKELSPCKKKSVREQVVTKGSGKLFLNKIRKN